MNAASHGLVSIPGLASRACPPTAELDPPPAPTRDLSATLQLLEQALPITRRLVRAGDTVYRAGQHFSQLHVVHSGLFKLVNLASDGREQVVALSFKGDWLGFDGIADGRHSCDAVALDVGEVWTIRYDDLLRRCIERPALMNVLHAAMSLELARDRDFQMSLCTLPADARVAEFLRHWVDALASRGLRTDQITLRMSRAEIGSYLGMTLESVSRALCRLAREAVICFPEKGRREIHIPDAAALGRFVQRSLGMDAGARVLQ